jgi:hypothetical protein
VGAGLLPISATENIGLTVLLQRLEKSVLQLTDRRAHVFRHREHLGHKEAVRIQHQTSHSLTRLLSQALSDHNCVTRPVNLSREEYESVSFFVLDVDPLF